jgi:hypothetical protein
MQKFAHLDHERRVIGFYEEGTHRNIPAPNVAISDEAYAALLAGQSAGKIMKVLADGTPELVDLSLGQIRAALLGRIDAAADAARLAVAGDPLRAAEYQIAETEAKAYQAGGYSGDCPPSVKSWAEAKNWTAKQAADNILAEAAAWSAALYAIRDARLKAKEGVRNALTADAAAAVAQAAIDGINAKVANLGNAAS